MLRVRRELVNGAASSVDVCEEDNNVVETEDDEIERQGRHDHPDTAAGRQAPPPVTHRRLLWLRLASVARLTA